MDNHVTVLVQTASGGLLVASNSAPDPYMNIQVALTLGGLLLAGACICRMNVLHPARHKLRTRLKYLLMFGGSVALAGGPWFFPHQPDLGTLLFLAAILAGVFLTSPDWKHGPPPYHDKNAIQQELFDETTRQVLGRHLHGMRCLVRTAGHLVAHLRRPDR